MLKAVAVEVGAVVANLALFALGLILALRFTFPVLVSLVPTPGGYFGEPLMGEFSLIVLSCVTTFTALAVMTRFWTRHVLNVTLVSAAAFLAGMVALSQAMYMADRGDPDIMWRYIRPNAHTIAGCLCAAAGATLGWHIGDRLRRRHAGQAALP